MSPSPSSRLQLRGRLTRGAGWLVGIVALMFLLFGTDLDESLSSSAAA
jgi:hypothetical protein